MNLNEATKAQLESITSDAPRIICAAGPGAGKTATLVARIEHLIGGGVPAEKIAVMTFTNAAARELSARLPRQMRNDDPEMREIPLDWGHLGTLHSFALRMLKIHGEALGYGDRLAVVSPESAQDLIESKARQLGCKASMKALMELKGRGRPARTTKMDVPLTVIASYYDDLKTAGIVDYDTILSEFLALLTLPGGENESPRFEIGEEFSHLLVDEIQDSSPIDWKIYEAFPAANKFYVGDGDQSIFGFRGAAVSEMVRRSNDPGYSVIKLEENFRSREEICGAANRLISHNSGRVEKRTTSVKGPGGKVFAAPACSNEGEEIGAVARTIKSIQAGEHGADPRWTMAVIARTNFIADAYRKTLAACGIPVVERTRSDLPRDWALCRGLAELLVFPDNDALAFFYLIARLEKGGATPKAAREMAHAARRIAHAEGRTINQSQLHYGRVTSPIVAMQALAQSEVSRESQMIAAERLRDLPPGSTMMDFALSLAEVREYVKDSDGPGVRCLTIHGAKGSEADVVFFVGLEEEVTPGKRSDVDVEEERRLAFVAATRAREKLYLVHCLSRVTAWKAVVPHTPSRFIKEMMP